MMRAVLKSRPAQAAILALGVMGAFAASNAAAAISSNVYIDPRETFVLGGSQLGAFTVKGQNKGEVTVEVLVQSDGSTALIAAIAPGERFTQGFAQGEGALLRNTSTGARAHVKVRVTGTTKNLGMGYEGW